jgi:UrcA family protein
MFRSLMLFTAAVAIAAFAQGSYAQGSSPFQVVEGHADVAYGDLNLRNAKDARVMLRRIEHAATLACGRMPELNRGYRNSPVFVTRAFRECREGAIGKAVADLNAPLVYRVYAEAYGIPDKRVTRR